MYKEKRKQRLYESKLRASLNYLDSQIRGITNRDFEKEFEIAQIQAINEFVLDTSRIQLPKHNAHHRG